MTALNMFYLSAVPFTLIFVIWTSRQCPFIKVCRQSRKTFLLLYCLLLLLRFPTLVGNLSVFVLSFIIKVSDFSRKPFCFRFVFYYYFPFFLLQLHRPVISSSILYGFTSNFQDIIIMTRQCTVWIVRRIPQGVGTGRGPKVLYTL